MFLEKIEETAEMVAQPHKQPNYKEGMNGIKRILPMVCRPYPEWIPSAEMRYWPQKPNENSRGVPRILTPQELKLFLEDTSASSFTAFSPEYMVEIGN